MHKSHVTFVEGLLYQWNSLVESNLFDPTSLFPFILNMHRIHNWNGWILMLGKLPSILGFPLQLWDCREQLDVTWPWCTSFCVKYSEVRTGEASQNDPQLFLWIHMDTCANSHTLHTYMIDIRCSLLHAEKGTFAVEICIDIHLFNQASSLTT